MITPEQTLTSFSPYLNGLNKWLHADCLQRFRQPVNYSFFISRPFCKPRLAILEGAGVGGQEQQAEGPFLWRSRRGASCSRSAQNVEAGVMEYRRETG